MSNPVSEEDDGVQAEIEIPLKHRNKDPVYMSDSVDLLAYEIVVLHRLISGGSRGVVRGVLTPLPFDEEECFYNRHILRGSIPLDPIEQPWPPTLSQSDGSAPAFFFYVEYRFV